MENWIEIKSEKDFFDLVEKSNNRTQIIFKDSTHCGISAYAKERLKNGNDLLTQKADFNYLDLLTYRDISNLIANELKVHHQSPQIIVLKNKEVIYTSTHHSINPDTIASNI